MKISISIIKFLLLGALFIVSNENLYLSNAEDLSRFFDLFYIWMGSLFTQVWQITGYVVNSEWLPGNSTTPLLENVR